MQKNNIKRMFTLANLSLLVSGLSGCAAISEEECLLGDWYQLGLTDGQNGKKHSAAAYSKECAKYDVSLDIEQYNSGRDQGLKSFCTYENGVVQGKAENEYNNVCPADLSTSFLSGYTPNYNLAKAKSRVVTYQGNVEHYLASLDKSDLSEEDKLNFQTSLERSKEELKQAKADVSRYEAELSLHNARYEKDQLLEKLASDTLSDEQKQSINKRVSYLNRQIVIYENLIQVDSAIKSIKSISEVF